jgi:flagellar basal body-associated protein FliL
VSKNTTQNSTGTGFDLGKIVGSISPFFIIALIPLLFVIGALFYFFFMGDQERRVSNEDQEVEAELSNASEETEWREL